MSLVVTDELLTVTRECPDHGVQTMYMGQCPKCAQEIANGAAFRTIRDMMASSLEELAKRIR